MPDTSTRSIREAISDAVKEEPDSSNASQDALSESSVEKAPESQAASSADGFTAFEKRLLEGVSTEGWTDSQKKEFATVRKALEKGWHGSNAEHAQAKRFVETLRSYRITDQDIMDLVTRKQTGTSPESSVSKETQKTLKGIDRLIDEATDPSIREQLRESKKVIWEEAERVAEEKFKPLLDRVNRLESTTSSVRTSEVSAAVDALEDEAGYSPALIEKYRESLQQYGEQYPHLEMEEILFKVVPSKELKEALAPNSPGKSKSTMMSRNATKSVSVAAESPLASEEELKPFKRGKGGGWNMSQLVRHVVGKAQRRET